MNKQTQKSLFTLGLHDAVLAYFEVNGPFVMARDGHTYMMVDFSEGADININTIAQFSDHEMRLLSRRLRDESYIYHSRGRQAGRDIITFLANSGRFEQHIRSRWWYKLSRRVASIFRKAFALLRFWKYAWIVNVARRLARFP